MYDGEMVLAPIDTKEKLADVFTKALDTKQFQFLRVIIWLDQDPQ